MTHAAGHHDMEPAALLNAADHDAHRLFTMAETNWQRPVPHCPAWDAVELVRHTGGILSWMSAVVESNQRVSRRALDPAPENSVDLAGWYLAALGRTLDVLGSAQPDSETWTFSSTGDNRVRWWCRRLAVEVAIHRFDIEHATAGEEGPPPTPVDGDVAAAGIEEFVIEFLPGLLTQVGSNTLSGTLHLHATDGPTEWWIDLNHDGLARREHAKADTALLGIRSDLLLWLTNRQPSEALTVHGERAVLERWGQLRR
jgi:uncharacterized protein (TIGR03083 family)